MINISNDLKENSTSFKYLPFKKSVQPYFLLIIISFFVYFNTLQNELAYDDEIVISKNEYVLKGVKGIKGILSKDTYFSYYKQLGLENSLPGGRYRPLPIITYAIEQEFIGTLPDGILKADSWDVNHNLKKDQSEDVNKDGIFNSYDFLIRGAGLRHFVNVILFVLLVVVIYRFFSKYLLKNYADLVFLAILIFAVHPLHTEVVANIKSRDEILSMIFIFLSLTATFKYFINNSNKEKYKVFVFSFLALLCKEYALMLIVLLPILIYVYKPESIKMKEVGFIVLMLSLVASIIFLKYFFSSLTVLLIPFLFITINYNKAYKSTYAINKLLFIFSISIIGYLIMRFAATSNNLSNSSSFENDILGNPYLFATSEQKWASKIVVWLRYLKLMIVPYPLIADYSYNSIPYSNFASPLFWLSSLVSLLLIGCAVYFTIKKKDWVIGIIFFIIFFIPVSNVFLDIGATMGERLVFHSSIGICLLISFLVFKLLTLLIKDSNKILFPLLLIFVFQSVVYGIITINRNADWKNNKTLFSHDVQFVPNNISAILSAGASLNDDAMLPSNAATKNQLLIKSNALYDRGIKILPTHFPFYLNKGNNYYLLNELDSAIICSDSALKLAPNFPNVYRLRDKLCEAYMLRGIDNFQKGDKNSGIKNLLKAISLNKSNTKAWNNLGKALYELGAMDKAKACFETVLNIEPNNQVAAIGLKKVDSTITQNSKNTIKN